MIELAEARVAREVDVGVAGIRGELAAPGTIECFDCGAEISAARRRALPSAIRCLDCQESFERGRK